MADSLEARVTKIEKHLVELNKWLKQVAKLLQQVDIDCVVDKTGCKQDNGNGHGGVPSNPPPWP